MINRFKIIAEQQQHKTVRELKHGDIFRFCDEPTCVYMMLTDDALKGTVQEIVALSNGHTFPLTVGTLKRHIQVVWGVEITR